ncbi:MAG: hypothetical protein KKB51_15490 [Candidatus Riflebacteria bacterium]|nr:hypothetical protein [Candidatus Riflebacteria bacterium]
MAKNEYAREEQSAAGSLMKPEQATDKQCQKNDCSINVSCSYVNRNWSLMSFGIFTQGNKGEQAHADPSGK